MLSIHKGHDEYVLAFDELAGGTAQDYSNHIFKTFQYLANLYSEWHGLDVEVVKRKMTLNIVNTLTDCAIVNQAAIRLLNSEWESNINVLYCNLHPLDTFACCCCLPTPMALASGGSPMFPLVVHQPASPSIWPAVQSLRRGLSTNPGATMWCVCGCS